MKKEDLFAKSGHRFYPNLTIKRNETPNRLYAFPLFGFLIKIFLLIPVFIEVSLLGIVLLFVLIINSFYVLINDKYWETAYQLTSGLIRLTTKIHFYLAGMTDKYPYFGFQIHDNYVVDIPMPTKQPNKLYAIPLFGGIIRLVLLIPYFIYSQVMGNASSVGVLAASAPVLFQGYYPESVYEITRDSVRISQASAVYMAGLTDIYPSFYLSMNNQRIKIILITLGALMTIAGNQPKEPQTNITPAPLPTEFNQQFN